MSRPPKPVRYEKKPMEKRAGPESRTGSGHRAARGVYRSGPTPNGLQAGARRGSGLEAQQLRPQLEQARGRQAHDVEVVPCDARDEGRPAALDRVSARAALPL